MKYEREEMAEELSIICIMNELPEGLANRNDPMCEYWYCLRIERIDGFWEVKYSCDMYDYTDDWYKVKDTSFTKALRGMRYLLIREGKLDAEKEEKIDNVKY